MVAAEQQGLTNVTPTLILAFSGIPPNTVAALGRYEAIANEYLKIANGSTATAILYMPGRDCSIPV